MLWAYGWAFVEPKQKLGYSIFITLIGAIPAFLKVRFNANEILVSLMLTYVAILLLSVMVHGPLRDPDGFNFPESRLLHEAATLPKLFSAGRGHLGFIFAIFAKIDEVVLAPGELQPLGAERPVKAPFAGVIKDIVVKEGQKVTAGDTLLKFDADVSRKRKETLEIPTG